MIAEEFEKFYQILQLPSPLRNNQMKDLLMVAYTMGAVIGAEATERSKSSQGIMREASELADRKINAALSQN